MMLASRRKFLTGVSLAALTLLLPSQASAMLPRGVAATPPQSFQGNPNVTVSSITPNTIACSRTSGKTPCFIQVSASNVTAAGTSTPYEDLAYSWDFGDPSGTETFTNPVTGATVNANSEQTGPEAAYCYRSNNGGVPYVVTLTIVGKNGSGYVTNTVTQSITVSAFVAANTWYYDANATGANNGTSPTNAYTALTSLSSNVNGATGATQIFLARGSHWSSTAYVSVWPSGALRISPYGAGADPIMECPADTSNPGQNVFSIYAAGGHNVGDVVVSHLYLLLSGGSFTGNDLALAGSILGTTNTLSDVYFDNCSFNTQMSSGTSGTLVFQFNSGTATGLFDRAGMWGGSLNSLAGDANHGVSFFGGAANWTFLFGLSNINGSGGASFNQLVHHIYASVHDHALFRWINFGSGTNRNYTLKIDNYPSPQRNLAGVSSGAGGVCRVQLSDTTGYTNGTAMYVEGVTGTGAADINGQWVGTVVDGTHIDLAGTTFNAGHTYTGGDMMPYAQAKGWLIDGCNITGTARAFDAQNQNANLQQSTVAGYIVQNCAVHDLNTANSFNLAATPIALSLTMRDCLWWNNLTPSFQPSQGIPQNHNGIFRIYRNKVYIPASYTGGSGYVFFNYGATGASWTNPQQFTDNIIQDMRTTAGAVGLDSYSAQAALPSIIDRNQYYAPSATASKLLWNGATSTTLATWKASGFDANPNAAYPSDANYGNPGWADPANGKF